MSEEKKPITEAIEPVKDRATDQECMVAAKQLHKYISKEPFDDDNNTLMEGMVKNGELDAMEMSPTIRVFRTVKRMAMSAKDLKKYGFELAEGYNRIYQLEISLVCDTVEEGVMTIDDTQATNIARPTGESSSSADEQAAYEAGIAAGVESEKVERSDEADYEEVMDI